MSRRASRYAYGYAVGRVRALETRLIDRARLQRMVDAPDAAEAVRVLGETDYAMAVAEMKDPGAFEQVLARELDLVYGLLTELAPEDFIKLLFGYRYDFHNLKVLVKSEAMGEDHSDLLVDRGTVSPELLTALFSGGERLPDHLAGPLEAARAAFRASGDPQLIDTVLDGALYELLSREARRRGYKVIRRYVEASIDLANIRTFLRVRRLGKEAAFLEMALLGGGLIDRRRFLDLYSQPLVVFASALADTPYGQIVAEGVKAAETGAQFTGLEKLADDFLLAIAKEARYIPLGPEPLFAYVLAKESEIRNIRIILAGKVNGVPAEIIRERLRDVYV